MYSFQLLEDSQKWNQFLNNYPTLSSGVPVTTFVQSFNWLDFQSKIGNKPVALAIYKNEELVGLCASTIVKAKRGKYLYVRNGPVMDWTDKKLVELLIKFLKTYAKGENLWSIRLSPLIERGSVEEKIFNSMNLVDCPMHDVEALDTWLLSLDKTEEEIFANQKKKLRYEIRQAQKLGCKVLITQDEKYVDDYYEILQDTVKRQGWNAYSKKYVLEEFRSFVKDNAASIILIEYENKYIAGGIFIHIAGQTFYHYGASMTSHKHIPGAYLMIWEAIKEAKRRDHKLFNFWGIASNDNPNHPWFGLTSFKKKFNGFEQRWARSKDIPVSPKYWLTNLYERIDKTRKGY